jgi:MraZ protein
MIIGVSNRMEIWAKEEWRKYYDDSAPSFEKTSENLLDPEEKG